MSEGHFIMHELRASDVEYGARFYEELFDWTATESASGKLLHAGEVVVANVSEVKPQVPPHWSVQVEVADVDGAVAAATSLGAIVTTGAAVTVPGRGRLAPILDPGKAIFLVAQPGPEPNEPKAGTFAWHRHYATDPAAAVEFYQRVLPWTALRLPNRHSHVFRAPDGSAVAETVPAEDGAARWVPFVAVGDLAEARARAGELGATIRIAREELGDHGQLSVIVDPQGAELALYQLPR